MKDGFLDMARWLELRPAERGASGGVLSVGMKIGEWRIVAYLGRGISAEVYRVTNFRFGHEGALKLLIDDTRGLKDRFLTEIDAIRFLSIRALPRFMGAGVHEGKPFYVMEYLQPLPDPMPRGEVPAFMNGVAKAVQQLHDAGYIHRDLKPGNILRRANGEPVLIDLGLIKKRGTGVTDPIVRHGRNISMIDGKPVGVGTLDYAAPEQLLKGESSVQSDIFALGKILRRMYEGRLPHNIKPVIRRATRELPADRYESADAFAAALRHRNYTRLCLTLLLTTIVTVIAAFPLIRPHLAAVILPILNPQKPVLVMAQRPDETDAVYFARMLDFAEKGSAQAQIAVAEAFFYGRGTATNRTAAVQWYRKSAAAGEADAQASLALCLFRGWGCEKDISEAVRWWGLAAEQGNLAAMNDMAFCYMHGFGVEKDCEKAFQLAMRAAERGFAPSQTMVGECYLDGCGVEKNTERGETWLYRASRQNNKRAQMLLRKR